MRTIKVRETWYECQTHRRGQTWHFRCDGGKAFFYEATVPSTGERVLVEKSCDCSCHKQVSAVPVVQRRK
jgi:hypothetical protein